jgi:alpha-1,2-mannosyltransferase
VVTSLAMGTPSAGDARLAPGVERRVVAAVLSLGLAPPAFVGLVGIGVGSFAAGAAAVVLVLLGFWRLPTAMPALLDGAFGRNRVAALLWLALACVGLVLLGRLSLFMVDPSAVGDSVLPSSAFMTRHSCLTAYTEAARFGSDVPNVYAPPLYRPDPPAPRMLAGFQVDTFMYPPPFLLLPGALRLVTDDFLRERMIWYLLDFALVVGAMLALARWIGGRRGLLVGLLVPAVLVSVTARISLQMGNFQLMAAALSVLAMVAFERGRALRGAPLLAFAIASKLHPGLLLVYLLARRKFREVGLTLGFLVLYVVLVRVFYGGAVLGSFVGFEAPRLASGAAFGMLHVLPWAVTINESVYGLVLKLGLLGVPGASFPAAGVLAWAYTLALVVVAVLLGRRGEGDDRLGAAATWLALLGLASLRAPFLPQEYGLFLPVWLLSIVVARSIIEDGRRSHVIAAILAWAGLNVLLPFEAFPRGVGFSLLVTSVAQAIAWALLAWTVVRALRAGRTQPAAA